MVRRRPSLCVLALLALLAAVPAAAAAPARAPILRLVAGPEGVVVGRSTLVRFHVRHADLVRCRLDGRLLRRCETPLRLKRLRLGGRVLKITASNARGTRGLVLRWTVKAPVRPRLAVTARPPAEALVRSATVTWTTSGDVSRTTCALDGATPRTCGTSRTLTRLTPGAHELVVRAIGPAGIATSRIRWRVLPQRVYWGAYVHGAAYGLPNPPWDMRAADRFEADAGKRASILFFGLPWYINGVSQPFRAHLFEAIRQRGSIPMVDWLSWELSAGGTKYQDDFQLADIIRGDYDAHIRTWAEGAKAWGHPFFLRFGHEMNGSWFPWAEAANGNRRGEFVRAWRHVHDIFTQVGATNATWVWAPNQEFQGSQPLAQIYPGDAYVDWVGMDGYNWGSYPDRAGWVSFDKLFESLYRHLGRIAPTKPVMVAEFAANESGGSKSAWIRRALETSLPETHSRVRAVVWFNWGASPGLAWPIESSPASLRAFRRGIGLPYYAANEFRDLPPGPIRPLPKTS